MSPPGRPKGESLSAQREGSPVSPPGRPKGESPSAQREVSPVSAQREGSPVSAPLELVLARAVLWHAAEVPRMLQKRARQHVVDCAAVALAGVHEAPLAASRTFTTTTTTTRRCASVIRPLRCSVRSSRSAGRRGARSSRCSRRT